jgi:L-alanine-DL-glutamate epimerase-like enolase superfamily enzyme
MLPTTQKPPTASTNLANSHGATKQAQSRRSFLKAALGSSLSAAAVASAGASTALATTVPAFAPTIIARQSKPNKLKLTFKPYTLELKHTFTVALNTRTTTPVVLTQIQYGEGSNAVVGYGEASMPPYLGETQESVMAFLSRVDLGVYESPFQLEKILSDIDSIMSDNTAAKASIDIALHDLVGKLMGQPLYNVFGYDRTATPLTSFTIGIDKPEVVRQKVKEADEFKVLKVKLGRDNDKEMIDTIRSVTDKPLYADANQGWRDKMKAVEMLHWLKEKNVVLLEQPMPKDWLDENAWVTEHSPIPVIADESCKRLAQVAKLKGAYHGINIKLMKSTGLREAVKMIALARGLNMKVMIGCMTETSCGITAAAHLTPAVDWADLDGALLIKNDAFKGMTVAAGRITLPAPDRAGLGIVPV